MGRVRLVGRYGYYPQYRHVESLMEIRMMRMGWAEARRNKELTEWRFAAEETDDWELKLDKLMEEAEEEKQALRFVARYEKGMKKYREGSYVVVLERNSG